jgi:hypothetical protein
MNPFDRSLSLTGEERSLSPTVEDLLDESFITPSSPPLRPDSPIIEPIDDDIAGSLGRFREEQRGKKVSTLM